LCQYKGLITKHLADLLLLRRRVPASSPLQNACQFAYFPCLLGATRKERQARRVKNRRKIYEIYNPYFYISKIFLNKLLLMFLNYFDDNIKNNFFKI